MKLGVDCVKCKGKLLCGLPQCPILKKLKVKKNLKMKKEFKARTPGVFIGWNGYPSVFAGVLTPIKKLNKTGPREWVINKSSIIDVMNYRASLINSRSKVKISELKGFNEYIQNSALSQKPLMVDVSLNKVPELRISYNIHSQPLGPAAEVKELIINEDPKMSKPVQKAFYDNDLKASEAIKYLKKQSLEEYEISSLLSAGTLGVKDERKLVPTRWAITATDDTLSKEYLKQIRHNKIIDQYLVFHGKYLGNLFTVMLLPRQWSFELFELWMPGAVFSSNNPQVMTDYERFNNRKNYAKNTGGGYYAARLPITEWLQQQGLQATVIAIRQITKDYYMPLGVWVVREAMRKSLQKPKAFSNYQTAKTYVERVTGFDLRNSKLITNQQTTLNSFKL